MFVGIDSGRAKKRSILTLLIAALLVAIVAVSSITTEAPQALADDESSGVANRPTASEVVRIGYYTGDPAFQTGFSDDERKSGYAYDYYQQIAPYAGWDYEYEYLSRSEALDALRAGEVDIVAGIYKTPKLEEEFLFSANDMGLEGEPRYFVVNKNNAELLAKLDAAQEHMLNDNPNFEVENWQEYYSESSIITTLSKEDRAYLEQKGSIKLAYLMRDMPISGSDSEGKPTGVIGAVIPLMEEYLGIPIEPVAYLTRSEMEDAISAGEVDVIFPVHYDIWASDKSGYYQTDPVVEDKVMIAYTGEYNDHILNRVALSDTSIAEMPFITEYDLNTTKTTYPNREAAFEAVRNGEANSVVGSASIMQLWIAEHPEYDDFNTAYLDESQGFSFAVRRDEPMLAVVLQETVAQLDDAFVNNAMIRYSYAHTPFSLKDVIEQYSLPLMAIGLIAIAAIVIAFVFYRKRTRAFSKQQQLAREALETALAAADEANAAKTSFLSNMSHDIRTPLNAIIGMTAIAGANIDDRNRVKDCLAKISSSGKHLLALINEILDVSKIESGRIELSEERFELSEMLNDMMSINMPLARAKNQKVVVRVVDVQHESVIGDRVRLQQIYTNLVSNAIKYTKPHGCIEITLVEKPSNSPSIAEYDFIVKDDGIGMSEEYLPHLFEAFTRDRTDETKRQQGTGLGMPIALSTARMMNGDITVESKLGEGSTFTATVFLKTAEHSEIAYDEFVDLHVLLVDDDRTVCESTRIMLEDLGIACDYVLSGQDAVEVLAGEKLPIVQAKVRKGADGGAGAGADAGAGDAGATGGADATAGAGETEYYAAIIDWVMPEMDGVETIREIRRRTDKDIPIIVISAYDWTEIEEEAREAGASYFVSKPLFKSRLAQLFTDMLGGDDQRESDDLNQVTGEVSFAGKRALLVEDNELNVEVASAFLSMTGLEIEVAVNGEEAVAMVSDHEPGYYDCVFMDVQMPIMNGYEATRAIRALDRPDTDEDALPIFAMTANAFADDVRRAKRAGMTGHFAKPLDFNVVIETVNQYLGKK